MVLHKVFFFFYDNFIGFRARPRLKHATPLPRGANLSLRRRVKKDSIISSPHEKALEDETCCVCLSSMGRNRDEEEEEKGIIEISVLPCLHEFHKVCVDQWFEERRRTCPICRCSMEGGSHENSSNQILTDEMVIWFSSFHTSGF